MSQNQVLPSITINELIESAKLRGEFLTINAYATKDYAGDIVFDHRIAVTVPSADSPAPKPDDDKTKKALNIVIMALAEYSNYRNWIGCNEFRDSDNSKAGWEYADRALYRAEKLMPGTLAKFGINTEGLDRDIIGREVDV